MGERYDDPEVENLRAMAERWGTDPVHPDAHTYVLLDGRRDYRGPGEAGKCLHQHTVNPVTMTTPI